MPDLQAIFADTILKAELGPDEKDERVYDLNPVRSRQFSLSMGRNRASPTSPSTSCGSRSTARASGSFWTPIPPINKHAIFDQLDKVAKGIPLTQMAVTEVGIKATFAHNPISRKATDAAFDITWPNSCSLKHDGRDGIIRKMLADSGIQPREPAKDDSAAT